MSQNVISKTRPESGKIQQNKTNGYSRPESGKIGANTKPNFKTDSPRNGINLFKNETTAKSEFQNQLFRMQKKNSNKYTEDKTNENNNLELDKINLKSNSEDVETKEESLERYNSHNKGHRLSQISHVSSKISFNTGSRQSEAGSLFDIAIDIDTQQNLLKAESAEDIQMDTSLEKSSISSTPDQYIKAAIPILPLCVSVVFLAVNIILPGIGTIFSGFSVFCCGKPKIQTKDSETGQNMCVNLWVGVAQLVTVPFMLVGWFWSLVWGIYMIILSVDHKKKKTVHKKKEIQAKAIATMNSNIRPWMLKT